MYHDLLLFWLGGQVAALIVGWAELERDRWVLPLEARYMPARFAAAAFFCLMLWPFALVFAVVRFRGERLAEEREDCDDEPPTETHGEL